MPPPHHERPPPPRHHAPGDALADDPRLDDALRSLVDDPGARRFVLRCLVGEGPQHHRASNQVLVLLLAELVARLDGARPLDASGPQLAVAMRLPPHLRGDRDDQRYPISVPRAVLERLSDDPAAVDAMARAVVDGPPQHAVANVVMLGLLAQCLAALEGRPA
ncbi:MAG: hypothetical protein JNK72_22200 [Myxococcales bacterium]|nr:hypothetical protein [Myxococcales bacterium]